MSAKYKKITVKCIQTYMQNTFSNFLYSSCTLICTFYTFYLVSLLSFLAFSAIYVFSSATSSILSILDNNQNIVLNQDIVLKKNIVNNKYNKYINRLPYIKKIIMTY